MLFSRSPRSRLDNCVNTWACSPTAVYYKSAEMYFVQPGKHSVYHQLKQNAVPGSRIGPTRLIVSPLFFLSNVNGVLVVDTKAICSSGCLVRRSLENARNRKNVPASVLKPVLKPTSFRGLFGSRK